MVLVIRQVQVSVAAVESGVEKLDLISVPICPSSSGRSRGSRSSPGSSPRSSHTDGRQGSAQGLAQKRVHHQISFFFRKGSVHSMDSRSHSSVHSVQVHSKRDNEDLHLAQVKTLGPAQGRGEGSRVLLLPMLPSEKPASCCLDSCHPLT